MPPKKKANSSKKCKGIAFHSEFQEPTSAQRKDALGKFPCTAISSGKSRGEMLQRSAGVQPSLVEARLDCKEGNVDALSDLNNKRLFIPTSRSETSYSTPKPVDKLDWLAQVPEEGQTYDDYLRLLTTRTTGRIRPLANAEGIEILLLPIIRSGDSKCEDTGRNEWPEHGPSIEKLVDYTRIFFDRPVSVLPAATLDVTSFEELSSKKKRKVASNVPGAFANASKRKFTLKLPTEEGNRQMSVKVAGRGDITSDRIQLQVTSLLDVLSSYRYGRHDMNKNDFCIMGITLEDLYDGPSDLFCAGMAFGGDKCAIFSFARYHPLIKMHPGKWWHYGYADESDGYSYYEDDDQDPVGLRQTPFVIRSHQKQMESEFLRRSCKLLTHELGHLYALDHCIHNRCLMMGTGHLVEDYRAPSHLCGICLRKLCWRTGFDVIMRYKLLTDVFTDMGLDKESKWAKKQYEALKQD